MATQDTEINKEKSQEIEKPDRKKDLEKFFRVVSIVVSIGIIILVSYLKYTLEDFNNWWIILAVMFIVVLLFVIFFGFSKVKEFADTGKNYVEQIPSPRPEEELYELARESLRNKTYLNDIRKFNQCRVYHIGKSNPNSIYVFDVQTLYPDNPPITHIIINANYPQLKTILTNPSYYELNRCIKSLSVSKEEDPHIEEETSTNPLLGVTTTRRVSSPYQREKEKKEGKKELE